MKNNDKSFSNVKLTDQEFEEYRKKHIVNSKRGLALGITIACVLVALGGLTAGHFAYLASHQHVEGDGEIVLDPTITSDVKLSEVIQKENGDKEVNVTSETKNIKDIKVSIGLNLLIKDTDFKIVSLNLKEAISGFKVTILKNAISKYRGAISITPIFETAPSQIYHTVTFDCCDGDTPETSKKIEVQVLDGKYVNKIENPTRDAFAFAGWYVSSTYEDDPFDFKNTPITKDTVLYAKWINDYEEYLAFTYDDGLDGYLVESKDDEKIPMDLYIPDTYNGKNVVGIPYAGFQSASMYRVYLSSNTKIIGEVAFHDCKNLRSVEMTSDDVLETIKLGAFNNCNSLETVFLGYSVKNIESGAFHECSKLNSVIGLEDKLLTLGDECFYRCVSLEELDLSHCTSMKSMGDSCFSNCINLKSVSLPYSTEFTTIPDACFYGTSTLYSVELPENVVSIGVAAFQKSGLKSIDLSHITELSEYCFQDCLDLQDIREFSSTITIIPTGAFSKCCLLQNYIIPKNINSIDASAFSYINLKNVDFLDLSTTWNVDGETWTPSNDTAENAKYIMNHITKIFNKNI